MGNQILDAAKRRCSGTFKVGEGALNLLPGQGFKA